MWLCELKLLFKIGHGEGLDNSIHIYGIQKMNRLCCEII